MKKVEYNAPEMEVVKLRGPQVLLETSGEHPGIDETPGDGSDAA